MRHARTEAGPRLRPPAPTVDFLLAHPAHFLALGLGTGLSPRAPGTVGTLLALPLHGLIRWLVDPALALTVELACVCAGFVLGVRACERTGRDLGVADHGAMNWDETVAYLAVLAFTGDSWVGAALGFALFRFFDIVKPPPVGTLDRRVKGGLGVMLDDLAAALCTIGVLALVAALAGGGLT
jgi:phosphatidylglycerophosphatase A